MKKIFIKALLMSLISIFFFSCKKDSTPASTPPPAAVTITGYWFGPFSTSNGFSGNEGQVFKSDGTMVIYDFYGTTSTDTATCPLKGYGTYTFSGTTFTSVNTYPSVSLTFNSSATINTTATPNTITGTFTSPSAAGGNFTIIRQ